MKPTDSDITIRRVLPEDACQIADIYNYYVRETTVSFEVAVLSVEDMRGRIERILGEYPYFVAERGGEILGYCYAHEWKESPAYRRTFENTVYLRHGLTSHGVGRRLMETLIDACRDVGCHALIACITTENEGSRRFHRALGFREVSHFSEVGYKLGRYLDVTDMELLLGQPE